MFGFKPKKPAGTSQTTATATAVAGADAEPAEEPQPLTVAEAPVAEPANTTQAETANETESDADSSPDSMLDITASQPTETEEQEGQSSLADLFAGATQQEEKNSLAAILERTPDASVEELLDDLNEIREMLRGRLEEQ